MFLRVSHLRTPYSGQSDFPKVVPLPGGVTLNTFCMTVDVLLHLFKSQFFHCEMSTNEASAMTVVRIK